MQGGRNLFTFYFLFFYFYFWVIVYFSSILYSAAEILDFKWTRANYGQGLEKFRETMFVAKSRIKRSSDTTVVNQTGSPGKYPL
jgi:hypothetical protein